MNAIKERRLIVALKVLVSPFELVRCKPMAEKIHKQAKVLGIVLFDFYADSHERLRELAEGVAT